MYCTGAYIMVFFPTGNESLWNPSRLIEVRCDWGRPSENLDYKHTEINHEKLKDR